MAWNWKWVGDRLAKSDRNRSYYSSICRINDEDQSSRVFHVGDTVSMNGEEDLVWVAHLIELFEVHEDDGALEEVIDKDVRRNRENKFAWMRCTLRWFYCLSDMNKTSLRRASVPRPLWNEMYFSDHVERDGYNDIQVIEGLAWLFSSQDDADGFEKDPNERFDPDSDTIRIVRCFVDSNAPDLPVRQLDTNELSNLLKSPSKAKDLYARRPAAARSPAGPVMKSTGGRKRKPAKVVSSSEEDESESSEGSFLEGDLTRTGRIKVRFNQEEEEDGSDFETGKGKQRQRKPQPKQKRIPQDGGPAQNNRRGARLRRSRSQKSNTARESGTAPHSSTPGTPAGGLNLDMGTDDVLSFIDEMNKNADNTASEIRPSFDLAEITNPRTKPPRQAARPSHPTENHLRMLKKPQPRQQTGAIIVDTDDDDSDVDTPLSRRHPSNATHEAPKATHPVQQKQARNNDRDAVKQIYALELQGPSTRDRKTPSGSGPVKKAQGRKNSQRADSAHPSNSGQGRKEASVTVPTKGGGKNGRVASTSQGADGDERRRRRRDVDDMEVEDTYNSPSTTVGPSSRRIGKSSQVELDRENARQKVSPAVSVDARKGSPRWDSSLEELQKEFSRVSVSGQNLIIKQLSFMVQAGLSTIEAEVQRNGTLDSATQDRVAEKLVQQLRGHLENS